MANAGIDQNSRQTLTALSSANDGVIVPLWADPTTHRLLVDNASGVSYADSETPSGTVNGVNVTFTLAHTPSPALSLQLFVNGQCQTAVTDYTLSTATITMSVAPVTDSIIRAWYRY